MLLQYIMLNLLSSLLQDVIEACRVARLSKGPHNYVTLAPFETATKRVKSIYRLEASGARLKYDALKKEAVMVCDLRFVK